MTTQSHLFPFEKLRVWQEARGWVKSIYQLTRPFPESERFGMVSQLNRAAVSVPTNLAEGSARISKKDQAHFTHLAYSSLMECMNLLMLACDQGFFAESELQHQREAIAALSAQVNALHQSQISRIQ